MLALKRIIGDIDGIPTMIFDEIDTGISGATAAVVGDKLVSIADNHQILGITHLPQIACKGNSHLKIYKQSDGTSTHTNLQTLDDEQRIDEVARLLSAAEVTDTARMQARELLGTNPEVMSDGEVEDIKNAKEKLMADSQALFQKVYEKAQAQGGAQGAGPDMGGFNPNGGFDPNGGNFNEDNSGNNGGNGDYVDADYKEV